MRHSAPVREVVALDGDLTMLELSEFAPREASYARLAHIIRERFAEPAGDLPELFARMAFNVLSGNTDDHARNTPRCGTAGSSR